MPKVSLLGDSKSSQTDCKDKFSHEFPRNGEKEEKEAEVKGGEGRREEKEPSVRALA